jgi:hypothetical protein
MKSLLLLGLLLIAAISQAQVSSPAFDPNCYFPSLWNREQIEALYGTQRGQHLGKALVNIGEHDDDSFGRLFLGGLPSNPPFMTIVDAGPSFDIEHLKTKTTDVPRTFSNIFGSSYHVFARGHFHNSVLYDLLTKEDGGNDYRIYWANNSGAYDSSNYSHLRTSFWLDSLPSLLESQPYIAKLTSDSVDDIVFAGAENPRGSSHVDLRLFLYKGGLPLFERRSRISGGLFDGDVVTIEDSSFSAGNDSDISTNFIAFSADMRGTGRKDLIALGEKGWFFYPNVKPFSLAALSASLKSDTLLTYWESPNFNYFDANGIFNGIAMPVVQSSVENRNDDFILVTKSKDSLDGAMRIFKGSESFGLSRISINRPDIVLHDPNYYGFPTDYYLSPNLNCGDMTGKGNPVLYASNAHDGLALHFFYVLGEGLDDKVDMFLSVPNGGAWADTLTANLDQKQDVVFGMDYVNDTLNSLNSEVGLLTVIFGSNKIPINAYSVVGHRNQEASITIFPNPARNSICVYSVFPMVGDCELRLVDVLGRTVYSEKRQCSTIIPEVFRITFADIPSGRYTLEMIQERRTERAAVIVQE